MARALGLVSGVIGTSGTRRHAPRDGDQTTAPGSKVAGTKRGPNGDQTPPAGTAEAAGTGHVRHGNPTPSAPGARRRPVRRGKRRNRQNRRIRIPPPSGCPPRPGVADAGMASRTRRHAAGLFKTGFSPRCEKDVHLLIPAAVVEPGKGGQLRRQEFMHAAVISRSRRMCPPPPAILARTAVPAVCRAGVFEYHPWPVHDHLRIFSLRLLARIPTHAPVAAAAIAGTAAQTVWPHYIAHVRIRVVSQMVRTVQRKLWRVFSPVVGPADIRAFLCRSCTDAARRRDRCGSQQGKQRCCDVILSLPALESRFYQGCRPLQD